MTIVMSLLSGIGYGGVTYFGNLLPRLVKDGPQHTYHFFVPHGHALIAQMRASNAHFHEVLGEAPSGLARFLFEQVVLPWHLWRLRADIVYTAKNINVLLAPCKTVIAIRNVEPFVYRQYRNDWRLNALSWLKWQLTALSVRRADGIVAVSNGVRERVAARFRAATHKVTVIYNGNPVHAAPTADTREPMLLTASKFVAYANQLNLVHGYAALCARRADTPPLFMAGGVHDRAYRDAVEQAVREHGLESRVHFLGLVPQTELFELYARASAFVFPSTLEACPHTLIEVMACRTPIATSMHPPMPEICEDAAVYFDAHDPASIADALERVLFDDEVRVRLMAASARRSCAFDWDVTARRMNELFASMDSPRGDQHI